MTKLDVSKIYGKIQFVDSFPDYKVEVVDAFPALNVQIVGTYPDAPGKWKIVEIFPDFKVQIVATFGDFKIKFAKCVGGFEKNGMRITAERNKAIKRILKGKPPS
jgi:hypothetical protein